MIGVDENDNKPKPKDAYHDNMDNFNFIIIIISTLNNEDTYMMLRM